MPSEQTKQKNKDKQARKAARKEGRTGLRPRPGQDGNEVSEESSANRDPNAPDPEPPPMVEPTSTVDAAPLAPHTQDAVDSRLASIHLLLAKFENLEKNMEKLFIDMVQTLKDEQQQSLDPQFADVRTMVVSNLDTQRNEFETTLNDHRAALDNRITLESSKLKEDHDEALNEQQQLSPNDTNACKLVAKDSHQTTTDERASNVSPRSDECISHHHLADSNNDQPVDTKQSDDGRGRTPGDATPPSANTLPMETTLHFENNESVDTLTTTSTAPQAPVFNNNNDSLDLAKSNPAKSTSEPQPTQPSSDVSDNDDFSTLAKSNPAKSTSDMMPKQPPSEIIDNDASPDLAKSNPANSKPAKKSEQPPSDPNNNNDSLDLAKPNPANSKSETQSKQPSTKQARILSTVAPSGHGLSPPPSSTSPRDAPTTSTVAPPSHGCSTPTWTISMTTDDPDVSHVTTSTFEPDVLQTPLLLLHYMSLRNLLRRLRSLRHFHHLHFQLLLP